MPFTPISTLLPRKMLKKHRTLLTLQGCMRFSGMEQIVTRHSIKTKIGLIGKSQQAQRINPHIGPPWSIDISIVILLKFFFWKVPVFPRIRFPRVLRGSFVEGWKCKRDCQFTTNFAGCQFDHLKLSANSILARNSSIMAKNKKENCYIRL